MHQADPNPEKPDPGVWRSKLIVRYTDGTINEEFFREAPHDYAKHLTLLTTVDSARIEIAGSGQPEWCEYRDGTRNGQAPH
ncbi:hypothetical protein [Streptomyces avermitilis]|uniref:hypothetical protein n=1 Tax=Streptomyces avermitilis TaxID=33903 RepID=UPI0033DEB3FE